MPSFYVTTLHLLDFYKSLEYTDISVNISSEIVEYRLCGEILREWATMTNIYFPDEEITRDDVKFICYMIERVARRLHQKNSYVVNKLGKENLNHLISVANVLHCKNPLDVEDEWIDEYRLEEGNLDITDVDYDLVDRIPTALQIGKVYERLIHDTAMSNETEVEGIIRVYNDKICDKIDNYNCSAYYEPSYVIARAYYQGGF